MVNICDGLKDFESGILLSMFDTIHVTGTAAHFVGNVFITPALLYAQLGYDGSESLTGRVCLARQLT